MSEGGKTGIKKIAASMVLPAPYGCNQKCPHCAIAQRGEALKSELWSEDYVWFLTDVIQHLPVERFSLQGYEPLLPEAWELTCDLLRIALDHDIQTSLVTNGMELNRRAEELSLLADTIVVSLDSYDPARNDILRGVPGAWKKTTEGLRAAVEHFGEDVTVNSVLFPKKAHYLSGMPKLLSELGVSEWVVSPLINFRKGTYQNGHQEENVQTILELAEHAAQYGVKVSIADDLRKMDRDDDLFQELSARSLEGETYLIRLSPDGSCARGEEVLGLSSVVPKWDRNTTPHEFVKRILADVGRRIEC